MPSTESWENAQKLEARFASVERIISDCRGDFIRQGERQDKMDGKLDRITEALTRVEESQKAAKAAEAAAQARADKDLTRHETAIQDLYARRDHDRNWLIGTMFTALMAMGSALWSILTGGGK